jgi:hypothetical protein
MNNPTVLPEGVPGYPDANSAHKRLGTDEFCRRLEELEPRRAPFFAYRDKLQGQLSDNYTRFSEWIEANELALPPELQDIRVEQRGLQQELDVIHAALASMWAETMSKP